VYVGDPEEAGKAESRAGALQSREELQVFQIVVSVVPGKVEEVEKEGENKKVAMGSNQNPTYMFCLPPFLCVHQHNANTFEHDSRTCDTETNS